MKYIDFNDTEIPVGKRKQAYVKWLLSKGVNLDSAKRMANKKLGFERKGKYLVKIYNADVMDRNSSIKYGFTWEDACGINFKAAEDVVIVCDMYYSSFSAIKKDIYPLPDMQNADEWAKEHGYKIIEQTLYP